MAVPLLAAAAKAATSAAKAKAASKVAGIILKVVMYSILSTVMVAGLLFGMFIGEDAEASGQSCVGAGASGGAVAGNNDGTPNVNNATIAYHVAVQKGATDRVILALMETGLVETNPGFYNWTNPRVPESANITPNDGSAPTGGDHDSVGILQQRPSAGGLDGKRWGTVEQLMDPAYAAGRFVDAAMFVEARGFEGSAGALAQKVQVSALPEKYDLREGDAIALLEQVSGLPAPEGLQVGGVRCAVTTVAGVTDPTLQDPGPGAKNAAGNTPRAQNIIDLGFQNWGCDQNPGRQPCVSTIGGYRPGSQTAGSDHPKGRAADIMTNLNGRAANPEEAAMGDEIAGYMRANATNLGITYIIWKQQIWNTGDADWRMMEDRGNPTQNHFDHIHVSVAA